MTKLNLIKQITKRHPCYGIEKKLSWYVGGMRDTGDWYYSKLMSMPKKELQAFYDDILRREAQPKHPPLTMEQQAEAFRKMRNEWEMKLITGE